MRFMSQKVRISLISVVLLTVFSLFALSLLAFPKIILGGKRETTSPSSQVLTSPKGSPKTSSKTQATKEQSGTKSGSVSTGENERVMYTVVFPLYSNLQKLSWLEPCKSYQVLVRVSPVLSVVEAKTGKVTTIYVDTNLNGQVDKSDKKCLTHQMDPNCFVRISSNPNQKHSGYITSDLTPLVFLSEKPLVGTLISYCKYRNPTSSIYSEPNLISISYGSIPPKMISEEKREKLGIPEKFKARYLLIVPPAPEVLNGESIGLSPGTSRGISQGWTLEVTRDLVLALPPGEDVSEKTDNISKTVEVKILDSEAKLFKVLQLKYGEFKEVSLRDQRGVVVIASEDPVFAVLMYKAFALKEVGAVRRDRRLLDVGVTPLLSPADSSKEIIIPPITPLPKVFQRWRKLRRARAIIISWDESGFKAEERDLKLHPQVLSSDKRKLLYIVDFLALSPSDTLLGDLLEVQISALAFPQWRSSGYPKAGTLPKAPTLFYRLKGEDILEDLFPSLSSTSFQSLKRLVVKPATHLTVMRDLTSDGHFDSYKLFPPDKISEMDLVFKTETLKFIGTFSSYISRVDAIFNYSKMDMSMSYLELDLPPSGGCKRKCKVKAESSAKKSGKGAVY